MEPLIRLGEEGGGGLRTYSGMSGSGLVNLVRSSDLKPETPTDLLGPGEAPSPAGGRNAHFL